MSSKSVILIAVTMLVCVSSICQADSLVITYKSGKTQTIVLDEPSQGINSWQFVSGALAKEPDTKNPLLQPENNIKAPEKTPDKKSDVRVNMNAKPIRE